MLVKCDNRPETVNVRVSNDDGVSVAVATRAAAVGTSQGRCTPRRDRGNEVEGRGEAEAVFLRPRQTNEIPSHLP